MFIPDFWCGVIATIAIEFAALISVAIWQAAQTANVPLPKLWSLAPADWKPVKGADRIDFPQL